MSKWTEPIAIALDDNETVLLRPLRKNDRAALAKAAEELSERSRYNRFHASGIRLTQDDLNYLTDVDQDHHVAWVVLDPNRKTGLAVGRYVRDQHDASSSTLVAGHGTASSKSKASSRVSPQEPGQKRSRPRRVGIR